MKVDLKKTVPSYAAKHGRFDMIDVPPLRYLAADAQGAPDGESFGRAVSALYPLAYAIKFASKLGLDQDYAVPPLEALWWADDMEAFSTLRDPSKWLSTALIMLPDWISDDHVEAARAKAATKVSAADLAAVRVETITEGLSCQTLHIGPFSQEGPVIEKMHQTIEEAGLQLAGKHHEIYLSDFRRTAPEKLRTILRQPAVP